MPYRMHTLETKGGNEPYIFTLYPISKETSSSKKLLKSRKVDEGKCKDDTRIYFLLGASCFIMEASGATFTTYVVVPR
jgi:hypothetical protein